METTRVCYKETDFDVYIGRPSKWGNPFRISKKMPREEVVELYEIWIRKKPELLKDLNELKGKVLGCWCKPDQLCHGDVLIKLIKEQND